MCSCLYWNYLNKWHRVDIRATQFSISVSFSTEFVSGKPFLSSINACHWEANSTTSSSFIQQNLEKQQANGRTHKMKDTFQYCPIGKSHYFIKFDNRIWSRSVLGSDSVFLHSSFDTNRIKEQLRWQFLRRSGANGLADDVEDIWQRPECVLLRTDHTVKRNDHTRISSGLSTDVTDKLEGSSRRGA